MRPGGGHRKLAFDSRHGALPGGQGLDAFRIKIWDLNNAGAVVYDNVVGDLSEDISTAGLQAISGGNIVIHK